MPNRNYNANNYRYGFNGKENDKSINEGAQDFGAREYDNKLGRFFSMDPFDFSTPDQSPFGYAQNNPLWKIDIEGEKTKYFDNNGNLLHESNDNLPNAVVILSELESRTFSYYMKQLKEGNRDLDDDDLNKSLRDLFGTKYFIETINKFHDKFKDFKYVYKDGTVSNYGHETGAGLFVVNGVAKIGNDAVIGDPGMTPWQALMGQGKLDNASGLIHTHDNGGRKVDEKLANEGLGYQEGTTFEDIPSRGDYESNSFYSRQDPAVDISVSESNITFYKNNGGKFKNIIIDPKTFKIKTNNVGTPYIPTGGPQTKPSGTTSKVTSYQNARFLD